MGARLQIVSDAVFISACRWQQNIILMMTCALKDPSIQLYSQAWKNGRPKSLRFLNKNTFFFTECWGIYILPISTCTEIKHLQTQPELLVYGLPTGMWKAEDECENEEDSDGLLSSSAESNQEEPNNRSQSLSAIGHLRTMVSQSKTAHINVTCFICGLIRIMSELSPH